MKMNAVLAVIAVLSTSGCGESTFEARSSPPKTKKITKSSAENAIGAGNSSNASGEGTGLTETFVSDSATGKVDVAWYIDQSGSMSTEAAQVQKNLGSFFQKIDQQADAKYAIVAASSGSNPIKLPIPASDKYVQIEQRIASNDALEIAIGSFIPAGMQRPTVAPNGTATVKTSAADGKLADFFRKDATPVVVVVTDDNANRVDQKNFLALAKETLGREPRLFAWRGNRTLPAIPNAICDVAANGIAYEELAKTTGGEVFNLCEPDWSPSFGKLTSNIIAIAKNTFSLKQEPKAVLSVSVDGRKIDPSLVTISGKTVSLPPSELVAGKKSTVVITYRVN